MAFRQCVYIVCISFAGLSVYLLYNISCYLNVLCISGRRLTPNVLTISATPLLKGFANMFHPVSDLTCALCMEGPQPVKHSSHSNQTLSVFRQRSFGDPPEIPHGRPRGDADALLKTLLAPSVSASTIPTSASTYFDFNILTKIIFIFVGYSPFFGCGESVRIL